MALFRVDKEILLNELDVSSGYFRKRKKNSYIGKYCNGCGSGWNAVLVPNSIYGLDIRICCCIHDYDYEVGHTEENRKVADTKLEANINKIIDLYDKWWYPTRLAKARAKKYRLAVNKFGASAFNYSGEIL